MIEIDPKLEEEMDRVWAEAEAEKRKPGYVTPKVLTPEEEIAAFLEWDRQCEIAGRKIGMR